MKQYEAVIKALEEAGGFATLGRLNQVVPVNEWPTKTPFATIRRIVQERPEIFKIRPGLWGLTSKRTEILDELALPPGASKAREAAFDHSYYQGLLLELGGWKALETYAPRQDQNKLFLSRRLADVSTLQVYLDFTYEKLLKRGQTIDVTWFNSRGLPDAFFEVEHSTDIQNSLLKYLDFQDFRVRFHIVAAKVRKREFEQKIAYAAFRPIVNQVDFWDYEYVAQLHAAHSVLASVEQAKA